VSGPWCPVLGVRSVESGIVGVALWHIDDAQGEA